MRFLLTPKWLVAHVLVTGLGVTFLLLGFWQMNRWQERRTENTVHAGRLAADPMPLADLLAGVGDDVESLEYRRALVVGTFAPEDEVLLRSQVRNTQAGFDVITPLITKDGTAVLVDRGWVPLEFDSVPVIAAPVPPGETEVVGIVRLTEPRVGSGHDDFARGEAVTISRVDLDTLAAQVGTDLAPVWLQVVGTAAPTVLPVPSATPDFADEGPHRDYAIQWFSFALIAAIGYGLLLRRAVRRSGGRDSEAVDNLDAGEANQISSGQADLG